VQQLTLSWDIAAANPPVSGSLELAPAGVPPTEPAEVEFIRHPRARRYIIRVRVNGSVRVTIPRRGSKREALAFLHTQQAWVARQRDRIAGLREPRPAEFSAEEEHAQRARARRELPPRLLELAAQNGLTVRKISVRNQQHLWGSCSRSGVICLNWRLVTMPDWVRDYVMFHELMHLKRLDHSPAFWKLVAEVCPNYQEARKWLRRHAHLSESEDAFS
jgi:predicted metal-dependent hydrolase